jgi:hypothetical protein
MNRARPVWSGSQSRAQPAACVPLTALTAIGAPRGGGVGRGRRHASRSAVGTSTSNRAAAHRTREVGIESESRRRSGCIKAGRGLAGSEGRRRDEPPARGTDWRANPEQVVGRGTDTRGTKARAHTTPQDCPARARDRRRERDDPGPGRRPRRIGGQEPRWPGTDATATSRRGPRATTARAEHDERDATGRGAVSANAARNDDSIRGGRCIAHVCGRDETTRTAREPGRGRADETNRHGCEAIEPGARGRVRPLAR